jgi:hypothetical protein
MSGDEDYDYDHDDEVSLERLRKQLMPNLYEDFARDVLSGKDDLYGEIIDQFTSERLQSFYFTHRDVAERALTALQEARTLEIPHPSAALVFAAIAIEVGLKNTLLKPILHGMVSIDSAAALVAALVPDQHNDSFKKVLFGILKEAGGVDLPSFKRRGCDQTLWERIARVRTQRSQVMHKASQVTSPEARLSVEIASTVLEVLFPKVMAGLNLKTDVNLRIVTT